MLKPHKPQRERGDTLYTCFFVPGVSKGREVAPGKVLFVVLGWIPSWFFVFWAF